MKDKENTETISVINPRTVATDSPSTVPIVNEETVLSPPLQPPPTIPQDNEEETVVENANVCCPICKIDTAEGNVILCDMCKTWVHQGCIHMTD